MHVREIATLAVAYGKTPDLDHTVVRTLIRQLATTLAGRRVAGICADRIVARLGHGRRGDYEEMRAAYSGEGFEPLFGRDFADPAAWAAVLADVAEVAATTAEDKDLQLADHALRTAQEALMRRDLVPHHIEMETYRWAHALRAWAFAILYRIPNENVAIVELRAALTTGWGRISAPFVGV